MRPGPKTDPNLGPLAAKTVMLDEMSVRQLIVVGDGNLSHGARLAARLAFAKYQATPETATDAERNPK